MTIHIAQEDRTLTVQQIQGLSSADRLAEFFAYLGYPEGTRVPMTAEALGLSQRLKDVVQRVEQLASVDEMLRIYLFELTSVTVAHTRALARVFRNRTGNFLLVLTDDYRRLDFVLLEREVPGLPGTGVSARQVLIHPRVLSLDRRDPDRVARRVLRRFTCTERDPDGARDPYAQHDKLRSAFTIAEWAEPGFNNVALFSAYYLNERLPELPVWNAPARNRDFRAVRKVWAEARRSVRRDATQAPDALIRPILETLGFRVEVESKDDGADFLLHVDDGETAVCVLAYPWHRYLDGKDATRDPDRPEQNPGAQVVALLEAEVAPWAIVTNGKTWRLYSARAHSRATNYYEIDLEETLAAPEPGEAFRYFYLLFRAAAFALEERHVAGETRTLSFVDWLLAESVAYARELGQRLKERVFAQIFPYFAEGFIVSLGGPEALQALPADERAQQLDAVYQATLTFLYRLLFLLYAESRELLPVREVRGYYQLSLRRMKEEIAAQAGPLEDQVPHLLEHTYATDSTALYERLQDLFTVVDRGSQAHNVPTYNGGLFITAPDPQDTRREAETARFLQRAAIPDRYLALGLDRLARDIDLQRGDLGLIDYQSLGVRQLGSIYEGLLEFKIRLTADEAGGADAFTIQLVGDKGERKATGSYYTPDYIVAYIVEQTVGPVLDKKLTSLEPRLRAAERHFHRAVQHKREVEGVAQPDEPALLQQVAGDVLRDLFDVKILDPAMGSGHFLVETVDFVTDRLARFLEGFRFMSTFFDGMRESIVAELQRQEVTVDLKQLTALKLLKRHVLKRCIYGVDLNPMAVELAKVSLWLDCFTLGAPLSFLDHHLRYGNSLIGARGRDVADEFAADMPLFGSGPFSGLLRAAQTIQQISANTDVTLDQVRESRSLYDIYAEQALPYKRLLDIRVARHFGVERADEFLRAHTPEQALKIVRGRAEDVDPVYREVVARVRDLYDEKRFFHWDLEFPEVFIDLERADWKENGGFDAVIGNPPYVRVRTLRNLQDTSVQYYEGEAYRSSTHVWDIYMLFLERAEFLARMGGFCSFIIPVQTLHQPNSETLRNLLLSEGAIYTIIDLSSLDIFEEVIVKTCILVFGPLSNHDRVIVEIKEPQTTEIAQAKTFHVDQSRLESTSNCSYKPDLLRNWELLQKIEKVSWELGDIYYVTFGMRSCAKGVGQGGKDRLILDNASTPNAKPYMEGRDVSRFAIDWRERFIDYKPEEMYSPRSPELFELEKIVSQSMLSEKRIVATIDKKHRYVEQSLVCVVPYSSHEDNNLSRYLSMLYVLSLMNSNLVSFFFARRIIGDSLGGGLIHATPGSQEQLPIRRIQFTTPEAERERRVADLVARYKRGEHAALLAEVEALLPPPSGSPQSGGSGDSEEKSDVVHDLLAHLAAQMIDLHQQKQARVEAFWADLAAATDAATFEDLREHGKWEQSLAKVPACLPFVDAESRSTKHLDESLGWDTDCYAAFVGLLAGNRA
ncbi:MAG: TaqI-like C-terminal specificity domain-containing protein, partial [Chloroflexota bacterium]|nr:TaqI-like C-terminal specificity domain-containing protein [Chloroflexota bacterium]